MGLRFDQVLNQLRAIGDGARVELTPVSNQDDQVVSYARGFLDYHVHRVEPQWQKYPACCGEDGAPASIGRRDPETGASG
jgi:hypothetical protein